MVAWWTVLAVSSLLFVRYYHSIGCASWFGYSIGCILGVSSVSSRDSILYYRWDSIIVFRRILVVSVLLALGWYRHVSRVVGLYINIYNFWDLINQSCVHLYLPPLNNSTRRKICITTSTIVQLFRLECSRFWTFLLFFTWVQK